MVRTLCARQAYDCKRAGCEQRSTLKGGARLRVSCAATARSPVGPSSLARAGMQRKYVRTVCRGKAGIYSATGYARELRGQPMGTNW